jgi:hypothetical protein
MNPMRAITPPAAAPMLMLFLMLALLIPAATAQGIEAVHDLFVQLTPARAQLEGFDRITIDNHTAAASLRIHLNAAVAIDRLRVNGADRDYRREGAWIAIDNREDDSRPLRLEIDYRGRFDDPAPVDPVNTDNPGFGVTGSISPRGTLLLAGAGWYPSVATANERFRLEVAGPPGTRAVAAGRPVAAVPRRGLQVSAWQIDTPVEGLALVAGNFTRREKKDGHLIAATYFLNDDPALSDQYLQATLKYLAAYEEQFGPYPFEKFAVVENFFPTGYGFPSFTLIGGRVLRLPFIIPTSLRHEIAHCWWGNGVKVDYAGGNWSEGLATYVSDYRYRELTGPGAARDYRRQMLRNYTELVPSTQEIPLSRFMSRRDPLTQAVGYDKAAMVFHMLRQRVGDAVFWETLRRIAVDRMFQATAWEDLQTAFETACGCSLETFFKQWIPRAGAPQLALAQIARRPTASGATVSGILRQPAPAYELAVPVQLTAGAATFTQNIVVRGRETPFEIAVPFVPDRLAADPGVDIFRRLDPHELPPTINRLKSARELLVILPDNQTRDPARQIAARLGQALGIDQLEMIAAADWSPERSRARNILMMQPEGSPGLANIWDRRLAADGEAFTLETASFERRRHTYVAVFPHPDRSDRFAAVYFFGQDADRLRIATKVPHYGRYSYLVFENTRNVAKGVWPVTHSPLIHVWTPEPAG